MMYSYDLLLLELRNPNLFQHDSAPVHKISSINTQLTKVELEELEWSD